MDWKQMPKVELHCHLDGSMRPQTVLDLAREQDVSLPKNTVDGLKEYLTVNDDCPSLGEYLKGFDVTLSVLQTAGAIKRCAYELFMDLHDDGVIYAEVRFGPTLHRQKGLHAVDAIKAVYAGYKQAHDECGIQGGVIACGIRHLGEKDVAAALMAAIESDCVLGVDLAGAEGPFPASVFTEAFGLVNSQHLPVTIHAGEADGAHSIHSALKLGARRIGHGTRLFEDDYLMNVVLRDRIHLEICPTSNVQTKATDSIAGHPAKEYYKKGVSLSISTDNRLISGVTLSQEYGKLAKEWGWGRHEFGQTNLMALQSSFCRWEVRKKLKEKVLDAYACGPTKETY